MLTQFHQGPALIKEAAALILTQPANTPYLAGSSLSREKGNTIIIESLYNIFPHSLLRTIKVPAPEPSTMRACRPLEVQGQL